MSTVSVPISNIYQKINGEWIENSSVTIATSNTALLTPYISSLDTAYNEIEELREMIERLKGKPYYMKIQCHNCGAPLVIDSSNHLIKCKYCHTAYFSGTQLVNSER